MKFIYYLGTRLYQFGIFLGAILGNSKAKLWINGRSHIMDRIERALKPDEKRLWFHASSLGEFEQGRPLIESIRSSYPHYKLFLTFFSPSGYEVRKNYKGADYIFYMPLDGPANATRFIDLVQPEKVFFIKYEFWYFYLTQLKKRNIPVYLCSANFRENQLFFKSYGGWYRKILFNFNHLFVQTESSRLLLEKLNYLHVTVTGDTRFDRVTEIAGQAKTISEVEAFVGSSACMVSGSTWEPDEDILTKYINEDESGLKFIIAPHEVHESHIDRLIDSLKVRSVRFSELCMHPSSDAKVLIIDNIGMLSSMYRYGQVAYIGGGFGKGIHNILEAATFGLPVLFGPRYEKFQEAVDLIRLGGAFSVTQYEILAQKLNELFKNKEYMKSTGSIASGFIRDRTGATDRILKIVMK